MSVFLDALFPRACVVCGLEGAFLCSACVQDVHLPEWSLHDTSDDIEVFSRVSYKDATVRRLLHAWKYEGDASAGDFWAHWMIDVPLPCDIAPGTLFIPSPLARETLASRGFNQADVLARALALKYLGTFAPVLGRFPRKAQAGTHKRARGDIVTHNPFVLLHPRDVLPLHVVFVDDVYTTGSTVRACAEVLRRAGVARMTVCTLAFGSDA